MIQYQIAMFHSEISKLLTLQYLEVVERGNIDNDNDRYGNWKFNTQKVPKMFHSYFYLLSFS